MRKMTIISLLSALVAIGAEASAAWVSVAKVTRVRTYTTADKIEVWFDRTVTTGCTYNDRVVLDTSYVTAGRIDRMQRLASLAWDSQGDVEVNTFSGCIGGYGRLDYLSIK